MATLSLALLGQAQEAERGTITGTVLESWEGKPLAGVTVMVRGTTLVVTTDARGVFN